MSSQDDPTTTIGSDNDHNMTDPDSDHVDISLLVFDNSSNKDLIEFTQQEFKKSYHHMPHFVARAPGRVNIIGEHIDYNGFGVLPMALQQSICVAISSQPNKSTTANSDGFMDLKIQSTSPSAAPCYYTYAPDELQNFSREAPFDASSNHDWSQYVLSAFFGICETLDKNNNNSWIDLWKGKSFSLLVHGTVPQGAGVSSSSALVVASALAFLAMVQQLPNLAKTQISTLCARCERWVGTEGGGMDQAIALFATEGQGRYIQFQPTFGHQPIPLPSAKDEGQWVVCNSLEESHKRIDASTQFNKRVVECKLGCQLLAQELDWDHHHYKGYPGSLWELVSKSGMSLFELETLVRKTMDESYSKQQLISRILGENAAIDNSDESMEQKLATAVGLTRQAGIQVLNVADTFCLRNRLLHVLSETRRVQEFVALCRDEEPPDEVPQHSTKLQALGDLMNHSHRSCSQLYECSSTQVDRLQQICLAAPGTIGSRMTGAGWGGCVVCLIKSDKVSDFLDFTRQKYYATLPKEVTSSLEESEYLFVTQPSQGANVFDCRKKTNDG